MASEFETLLAIESSGGLNPVQRTRLEELKRENPYIGGFIEGVPSFNFDFGKEAEKAYGELGGYYDRILKESKGDLNKALARLVEDYNTGIRIKREDTSTGLAGVDLQAEEAARQRRISEKNLQASALARGIYQKSAFDPAGGFGIADAEQKRLSERSTYEDTLRENQRQGLRTSLTRYEQNANVNKVRTEEDLLEQQRRKEFDLEQNRRERAGELANIRGERAYKQFQSQLF